MNMDTLPQLAIAHLLLRLQPLNRALRSAVEAQKIDAEHLSPQDLRSLCVTDQQVLRLLERLEAHADSHPRLEPISNKEERAAEDQLRLRAVAIKAILPLDQLSQRLDLTDFEQEAVLLCVAPELDRAYERVYAYVLDDLNRRFPCVGLLAGGTPPFPEERAGPGPAPHSFRKVAPVWGTLAFQVKPPS